jgi:DNA-binding MarR family transcriptional regulator
MAQEIWRPLFGAIEERWRVRFGQDEIGRLRESLATIISGLGLALPDCLPILGYGLASNRISRQDRSAEDANASDEAASLPLPALLSKVLLAFALEYERESPVSLAIGANVLRVTGDDGVRVRHLPRLTGVSKEALAMALGFLEKRACAVVKPESSGSRLKVFTLTTKGRQVREVYRELVWTVEERWRAHLGADAIRMVRASLEPLVGDATAQQSLLFRGLEPYPDGWRAAVPKPAVLPHYPMVLHRGGFPDGS